MILPDEPLSPGALLHPLLQHSADAAHSQLLSVVGDSYSISADGWSCDASWQVAQQLADLGWVADLVICSDSTRTRQTLEAMQEARIGLEVKALPTSKPMASSTTDGCD